MVIRRAEDQKESLEIVQNDLLGAVDPGLRQVLLLTQNDILEELIRCRLNILLLTVQQKYPISQLQQELAYFAHLCARCNPTPLAPLYSRERHWQNLRPFCRQIVALFKAAGDDRLADPFESLE